ncbi:MAG: hypothetical protein IPM17_07110 [Verrucomicrobia bacterium]|nr:hypothetical protein [Verrucomicrobiota bacterium]
MSTPLEPPACSAGEKSGRAAGANWWYSAESSPREFEVPRWAALLFPALAGGMGWGIRGQYGHETGAMIAGVLLALVLALLFCPGVPAARVARAVAWGTLAMGIGGSMTYGQTIGLTQDPAMVGNWAALRWGMLGLAVKGAIWIGFAGALLGMALSGCEYRWREVVGLMLTLLVVCFVGIRLLNEPYDPANRTLPPIYFSADWRWLPDAALKPRREVWGGLLVALLTLLAYLAWRRDALGLRLGLWGLAGGAVGFPLGQAAQGWAGWNSEVLKAGALRELLPLINWWNFMETIFGAVIGTALGLGLWLNRARIFEGTPQTMPAVTGARVNEAALPGWLEGILLAIHVALLVAAEFLAVCWFSAVYGFGLVMVTVPLVAVAGGRWWPYLVVLPLVMLPIAGKTVIAVVELGTPADAGWPWVFCFVLPLALTSIASFRFGRPADPTRPAEWFLRPSLLLLTWLFLGLNFVVFRFPWPWEVWTARTPNALVFALCAVGLTWLALRRGHRTRPPPCSPAAARNSNCRPSAAASPPFTSY